jgi:hypothetical protein
MTPNTTQAAATNKIPRNQPRLPLFWVLRVSLILSGGGIAGTEILTAVLFCLALLEATLFEAALRELALFEAAPLELVLFEVLLLELDFFDVFFALNLFGLSCSLTSGFLRLLPFFDDFLELFLTIYFQD